MTNNNRNQNNGQRGRRNNRRRRRNKKSEGVKTKEFWGENSDVENLGIQVRSTSDATAVIRSLGRPPFAGQQEAAELYLSAVCERAVVLAGALAAAGNLEEQSSE